MLISSAEMGVVLGAYDTAHLVVHGQFHKYLQYKNTLPFGIPLFEPLENGGLQRRSEKPQHTRAKPFPLPRPRLSLLSPDTTRGEILASRY